MVDLTLVPEKDLINEIRSRCDCCLFISQTNKTDENGQLYIWSKGDAIRMRGLIALAEIQIHTNLVNSYFQYRPLEGEV